MRSLEPAQLDLSPQPLGSCSLPSDHFTPLHFTPQCCEPRTHSEEAILWSTLWGSYPGQAATTQHLLTLGLVGWPAGTLSWHHWDTTPWLCCVVLATH